MTYRIIERKWALQMRVLMVMQHINFFRNLDAVMRELVARGHHVFMLHGTRLDDPKTNKGSRLKRPKKTLMGRGLQVAQSEVSAITVGYRPEPDERWHRALRKLRQVVNRSIYFRRTHPAPERVADLLEREMSPFMRCLIQGRLMRALLGRRSTLSFWRRIEAASPPSSTIVALLNEIQPDVILVSPLVWPKRPVEADYVRAARSLGIPVIGYVNSWDNLTSKGTVHLLPDLLILWNEALAQEAEELHDIPQEIIRVTGAPHLDRFFEMRPTLSPADMCKLMGCSPAKPYIVYLCTSRTLMASEASVVSAIADALPGQFPDGPPTLVVRPHPTNPEPWGGYVHDGVVVYPKYGDQADSPESWQEYYNQLSGAACVIGLNTTAFLESIVANRPCLTILSDEFYGAQGRTGHFRHLLAADFLEVSRDATEVAARVARIVKGTDAKAEGRRFFAQWFLRPRGIDTPASAIVADAVESIVPSGVLGVSRSTKAADRKLDLVLTTGD